MDIDVSHTYSADMDAVWKLQTDPDFMVEKLTAIGNSDVVVTPTPEGEGLRLVVKMTVAAELPGFAARALPSKTTLTQTYDWAAPAEDGSRSGTWTVESGTPVKASGTMSLSGADGAVVETIKGKVTCSLPLVGGKIADFVGKTSLESIRDDQAFTDKRLAQGA